MAAEAAGQPGCASRLLDSFLDYETAKVVHISNKTVGLINRIIQLGIVAYIAVYVIWFQRGYQEFDTATSATTTKLKGISLTNYTQLNISLHGGANGLRVWDVADYVVPPQENDAFFVTTNLVITPNQTQGRCAEDPSVYGAKCKSDSDCPYGEAISTGNGVRTGRCISYTATSSVKSCEIFAWCPTENDQLPIPGRALLEDSKDFTVLIKNYIEFPRFRIKLRNILSTQDKKYLLSCRFNKTSETDRLCPIFTLSTIMEEAGVHNYSDISVSGGVVVINIKWECNLDLSIERCLPAYTFSRLDVANDRIAKGTNFRYAAMYEKDGKLYRDLFKAYGIRFLIKATGAAGKFSIVPLLLNVGSGVGLLAVASIACDILVLYCMKKRHIYKTKKYLFVDDENPQAHNMDDEDEDDGKPTVKRRSNARSSDAAYEQLDSDETLLQP